MSDPVRTGYGDIMIGLPDGLRLHVEVHGGGEPDGGLAVVLLHGWTLDRRLWRRQIADLPARLSGLGDVRVLAVDLRGHGMSSPTAASAATMAQLADDLAVVIRELIGNGRAVLVGHSLGGMAVVEYAHRHPEQFLARVAGVVMVNSSAEGALHTRYGLPSPLAGVVRAAELGGTGVLARIGRGRPHRHLMPALTPAVRWLVFGSAVRGADIRLVTDMVGVASLCSIGAFRPAIERHRRLDALATMRNIPVTVLVGGRDRLTPPACGAAIAGALGHAILRVIDDAGHLLPLECPELVTDAIVDVCSQAGLTGAPRADHTDR